MQGYRTIRTKNGNYKFVKKREEFYYFTKFSNIIFPYVVAILAGYGFVDLLLTANGF
jgi:nitrate reductase NapE component